MTPALEVVFWQEISTEHMASRKIRREQIADNSSHLILQMNKYSEEASVISPVISLYNKKVT